VSRHQVEPPGPHAAPATPSEPPLDRRLATERPIDLRLTLGSLQTGRDDPAILLRPDGWWLSRRTADGPATLHLRAEEGAILARAWGPGAALALEAAPGLAGLLDDPGAFVPQHPLLRELVARFPGLRLPRTGQLFPALLPAVTGQKVTVPEAHRAYRAIVRRLGEPAPGPVPLLLPPEPARLASLPYFDFHPMGLERRRAEVIRRLGAEAARIESWLSLSPPEARAGLQTIEGIGPWTAAEATRAAFGDPDAVSLGDAHIPDLVAWALAGEPRADDARMLELLAPYPGQRARVIRLLEASAIKIPRFGPRYSPRRIERI
jgi:3-methyladenine DNA glycosylase/8-oxoguanine DNA glycosylase